MSGGLRRICAWLLATLAVMGVSACNQGAKPGGDLAGQSSGGSAASCGVSLLQVSGERWYTDVAGKLWVVGELTNTSGSDHLLPQVCVSIHSATGERAERRYAGPLLLRAGEKVTFSTMLDGPADDDFSVSLSAAGRPVNSASGVVATIYRDFSATASVMVNPQGKDASIHGMLTNTGGLPASNIFVAVGLYDTDGALVGVARGKVSSLDILDPGGTLTFTLASSQLSRATTRFTTHIFVEGQIAESSN